MFRKSILALTAVATVAGAAFATSTDASAKQMKFWKPYGYHYKHKHFVPGLALGVIGAATIAAATAPRCYEYENRWGEIVTRCRY